MIQYSDLDNQSDVQSDVQSADTVIILSSELIAEVMEKYFNKEMFKKQVKVVDLKTTEAGYMFSLAFIPQVSPTVPYSVAQQSIPFAGIYNQTPVQTVDVASNGRDRDKRGKFTRSSSSSPTVKSDEVTVLST